MIKNQNNIFFEYDIYKEMRRKFGIERKEPTTYEELMENKEIISYRIVNDLPIREESIDYEKLMVNLMSNEGEDYKRVIVGLFESEHHHKTEKVKRLDGMTKEELCKKAKFLGIKYHRSYYKHELIEKIRLFEIRETDDDDDDDRRLTRMSKSEINKIARYLGIKYYGSTGKYELIKKIEKMEK